jgi:hypothetical protein
MSLPVSFRGCAVSEGSPEDNLTLATRRQALQWSGVYTVGAPPPQALRRKSCLHRCANILLGLSHAPCGCVLERVLVAEGQGTDASACVG